MTLAKGEAVVIIFPVEGPSCFSRPRTPAVAASQAWKPYCQVKKLQYSQRLSAITNKPCALLKLRRLHPSLPPPCSPAPAVTMAPARPTIHATAAAPRIMPASVCLSTIQSLVRYVQVIYSCVRLADLPPGNSQERKYTNSWYFIYHLTTLAQWLALPVSPVLYSFITVVNAKIMIKLVRQGKLLTKQLLQILSRFSLYVHFNGISLALNGTSSFNLSSDLSFGFRGSPFLFDSGLIYWQDL